jgi:hypothetical protein
MSTARPDVDSLDALWLGEEGQVLSAVHDCNRVMGGSMDARALQTKEHLRDRRTTVGGGGLACLSTLALDLRPSNLPPPVPSPLL